jgi:hypothetical protein
MNISTAYEAHGCVEGNDPGDYTHIDGHCIDNHSSCRIEPDEWEDAARDLHESGYKTVVMTKVGDQWGEDMEVVRVSVESG